MHIKLVNNGLMIEAQDIVLIISDETFDPLLWRVLIALAREGVVYG